MSNDSSNATIEAVVCIPTFRRPEGLAETLRSLLEQRGEVPFAIVVVENDAANPTGAQAARLLLSNADLQSAIVIEQRQGNCHAINRAFVEARQRFPSAEYLLMIDDDEIAHPDWVENLVSTARRSGAHVVGGPVIRHFKVPVSKSISRHSLYGFISGPTRQVPIIHGTGNCLIRREVFSGIDSPLFDEAFNFLGGGDMDFFVRCQSAGYRFWWSEEAVVYETIAPERSTAAWLLRRSIRTGSINYLIDRKRAQSPLSIARLQVKNIGSLGLSVFRSAAILIRSLRVFPATHPLLMSVGRITASLGILPAPYKASSIPTATNKVAAAQTAK